MECGGIAAVWSALIRDEVMARASSASEYAGLQKVSSNNSGVQANEHDSFGSGGCKARDLVWPRIDVKHSREMPSEPCKPI